MVLSIKPFLMFEGHAGAAMNFYISLFPDAGITDVVRCGVGEAGPEGSIMKATFKIAGQSVMCIDSPAKHEFTFTPSFSFFVDCDSEKELRRFASALSDGGMFLMPIADYGFSRQFAWVNDKFGVSWQLNLP